MIHTKSPHLICLGLIICCSVTHFAYSKPIVVGAKAFPEGQLLGEILASAIEANTDLKVTRKFGLGGTHICFSALQTGAIDLYPEYTGTALVTILKEHPRPDPKATYERVKQAFYEQYKILWLEPFGFNNTYALAMRQADTEALRIFKISDLRLAPLLRAGFTREFLEREDGYPGLRRHYGLNLEQVRGLEHGLAYKAMQEKSIDIMDAYSTDGKVEAYHLRILEDDKRFFPPYYGAPIMRGEIATQYPALTAVLNKLGGTMDEAKMRRLNFQIELEGQSFEQVARNFLHTLGLYESASQEERRATSFWHLLWQRRAQITKLTAQHMELTLISVGLAILVGIPLGIALCRYTYLATSVMGFISVIQTIPSIALLGFMLPFLGIGVKPALAALFLYALLPIIQNTYAGIRGVDPLLIEAGLGMGMTNRQILFMIEFPLAISIIMAGIRTSTVINIGTATLAAFIGAGGLGEPIVTGLSLNDNKIILTGAVPAAILAVIVDFGLSRLERWTSPKGIRVVR